MSILDEIANARRGCLRAMHIPKQCDVAHDVYYALLASRDANTMAISPVSPEFETVFGMKVVVDPELGPGEWKLVVPTNRR